MNRKLLLLIVLLACLALPLGHLAAQEPTAPQAAESEPNDTIATADPIVMGDTEAAISPIGDVDYFRLSLTAGQRIYLAAIQQCYDSELETDLAVYDGNGVLLAETDEYGAIQRFIAPATANYFVRVISDGYPSEPEELAGDYLLLARNVPADEPDDPSALVPIPFGSAEIASTIFAPYDIDRYTVHARAGDAIDARLTMGALYTDEVYLRIDEVNDTYPYFGFNWLYAPGTARVSYVIPFESDYQIFVHAQASYVCDVETFAAQAYNLAIERNSVYVAGSKAGNAGGVAFGVNDVLARNTAGAWRVAFDGEDVGLTKPLGGVEFMDDGSLLLSVSAAQTLPGVGAVKPTDIVRFVPTQLGANTQGAFSFYLRGADAGLTTLGERIDAIALGQDGLMISTYGSAAVPQFGGGVISARDEDLLLYHPNGPMPAAGAWEMRLNGNGTNAFGSKFSANDLRAATVVDDYYDASHLGYDQTKLLFAADRPYRYRAYDDATGNDRLFTAAPGDPVLLIYHHYEQAWESWWPPIQRTGTLNFPRIVSSLSIGPGWNQ